MDTKKHIFASTKKYILDLLKDKKICYHVLAGEDFSPIAFFAPSGNDFQLDDYPDIYLFVDLSSYGTIPLCVPFCARSHWADESFCCQVRSCELIGKLDIPEPQGLEIDENYNNAYLLKVDVYKNDVFIFSTNIIHVIAEMSLFEECFLLRYKIPIHSSFAAQAMDYNTEMISNYLNAIKSLGCKYLLTNTNLLSKGNEYDFYPIDLNKKNFVLFSKVATEKTLEFLDFGQRRFLYSSHNSKLLLDFGAPASFCRSETEIIINNKKINAGFFVPRESVLSTMSSRFFYSSHLDGVIGIDVLENEGLEIFDYYCIFHKKPIIKKKPICSLKVKKVISGMNRRDKFLVVEDVIIGNSEATRGTYLLDSGFKHSYIPSNILDQIDKTYNYLDNDYCYNKEIEFSSYVFKTKINVQGYEFDFNCASTSNKEIKNILKSLNKCNNIKGIINVFELESCLEADAITYIDGVLSFYKI